MPSSNTSLMTPSRLKYPILGALAAAAPGTSSAAIVVFDTNDVTLSSSPTTVEGAFFGSINITNGTFTSGNTFGPPVIGFYAGPYYGSFFYQFLSSGETDFQGLLPAGSILSSGSPFGTTATFGYLSNIPLGVNYMGMELTLESQAYFGWFEFTKTGTDIVLNRFAFENTAGAPILVGTAVPEASTLGFAGGLFGLIAAAHLRRRRQKQAAASDRFLALAAGEKLN